MTLGIDRRHPPVVRGARHERRERADARTARLERPSADEIDELRIGRKLDVVGDGPGNLPPPPKTTHKPRALTRAQKLSRALKACAKKPRRQRALCQKRARSQYGVKHKTAKKSRLKH